METGLQTEASTQSFFVVMFTMQMNRPCRHSMNRGKSRSPKATCGCTGRTQHRGQEGTSHCTVKYQPGRSTEHPVTFMVLLRVYLHTDGYAGYHKLPEEITVVGFGPMRGTCLTRRSSSSSRSTPLLRTSTRGSTSVNRLFVIEQKLADLPAEERKHSVLNRLNLRWTNSSGG